MWWHGEAAVDWPTPPRWDEAWARLAPAPARLRVDDAGVLHGDDGPLPLRVVEGAGFVPGARLTPYAPGAPGLTGRVAVGAGRSVSGEVRLAPDPGGRVTVEIDTLDRAPRRLRCRSTLTYLAWDVTLDRDGPSPLTATVRLRWARAELRVRRREGRLLADVRATGRGLWRPVVSSLLGLAGRQAAGPLREVLDRLAASVGDVAAGREPDLALGAEQQSRRTDEGVARLRDRLGQVVRRTAGRPWWRGRGARAWRAERARLAPATWPAGFAWDDEERWLADHLARVPWRDREAELDRHLERIRRSADETHRSETDRGDGDRSGPRTSLLTLTDADLDLSWLATPRTTMRRLQAHDEGD